MTELAVVEKRTVKELLSEQKKELAKSVVAARVDGRIVDLHTPIDPSASWELIQAEDPEGLKVVRHSAAHVMADAVQRLFPGTQVTIGPAIEDGFYYDFDRPDGTFSDADLKTIEKEMARIAKGNFPFRREVVARDELVSKFTGQGEHYKVEIIESRPEGEELTLYTHGAPNQGWSDFCAGPHVPHTGYLRAVKLTSVAGAYWRGDEKNKMLQRIYGTAFASKEALAEHLALLEEAKKRDHRKLGKELDLFMFHEYASAMPFFLPRGTRLMNRLVEFVRSIYDTEGYDEVITPQIFDKRLFETSGHLQNYRENMYLPMTSDRLDGALVDLAQEEHQEAIVRKLRELEQLAQKPMNCPAHCLMYGARRRSYRELPMRLADFGRLHRYERGGTVHGLARLRTFSQDDAHIFCTPEQGQREMAAFLKAFYAIYKVFDFTKIRVLLATRPEQRIGTDQMWDDAEGKLEAALREEGLPFQFSPGEGAFYGPKLEFHVEDALKRSWQLGTLQLDYALPERFELNYIGEDGAAHRPMMLHRAWYGSLERFLAVFIEHVGGSFPTWIAPEQVAVLTVSEKFNEYALEVANALRSRKLRVVEMLGSDKLGAKIREGRMMRYPYLAIVGQKEMELRQVSVRSQAEGELGTMALDDFLARVQQEAVMPALAL
jgi:threonyl-tRNA synthetase